MSRKFLIALVALIVVAFAGYCFWSGTAKQNSIDVPITLNYDSPIINKLQVKNASSIQTVQQVSEKRIVALSDWKTYTNTKLGFTFQYPSDWVKDEKDAEVVNRLGVATEIDINFTDTVTQTSFLLAYHFPPNGKKLYDYAASQLGHKYAEGTKQIDLAGTKAIQSSNTINADGRGHALKPYQIIIVDFLDKKHEGEFQLQFKTALPSRAEASRFNQLLSTFKFTS